jgi:hypothetical protein
MARVFQGPHECFAQMAGAAGDEDFQFDFAFTISAATPRNATPITNCIAAIFRVVAGQRLLVKSSMVGSTPLRRPDILQPNE